MSGLPSPLKSADTIPRGADPMPNAFCGLNVIALAFAASNDWSLEAAALKLLSPGCDARTVTVPAAVMVIVLPLIVAGPDTMVKLIARPDDADALTVNGGSPTVL